MSIQEPKLILTSLPVISTQIIPCIYPSKNMNMLFKVADLDPRASLHNHKN